MRWQRQHWSTEDFDFSEDARQWADPDLMTRGGARVPAVRLLPVLPRRGAGHGRAAAVRDRARPTHEAQAFLTTQISDEAKHMVFFDRFYREVLGMSAGSHRRDARHAAARTSTRTGSELFDGILHDCAERCRKDPSDFEALVRGITVYMVVIEGTLALTGARFIIRSLKERDWLPGFTAGLHRRQPRRVAPRRLRRQVPRRRDQGRPGERRIIEDDAEGDAAGRDARLRAAGGRRPLRLPDAVLPLGRDLRVRDEGALEEAGGDGARPGDARRRRA